VGFVLGVLGMKVEILLAHESSLQPGPPRSVMRTRSGPS
jgi:hypothetical protein